jgi:hypothetical protein
VIVCGDIFIISIGHAYALFYFNPDESMFTLYEKNDDKRVKGLCQVKREIASLFVQQFKYIIKAHQQNTVSS